MNVNSDETARKIIEYSTHDTRPSDDDIAQARGVLDELTRGIGEYIAQLETDL
jgi:hypothetical protein